MKNWRTAKTNFCVWVQNGFYNHDKVNNKQLREKIDGYLHLHTTKCYTSINFRLCMMRSQRRSLMFGMQTSFIFTFLIIRSLVCWIVYHFSSLTLSLSVSSFRKRSLFFKLSGWWKCWTRLKFNIYNFHFPRLVICGYRMRLGKGRNRFDDSFEISCETFNLFEITFHCMSSIWIFVIRKSNGRLGNPFHLFLCIDPLQLNCISVPMKMSV